MDYKANTIWNRRRFIQTTGAAALGGSLVPSFVVRGNEVQSAPQQAGTKRVLRIAHLTDLHVFSSHGSPSSNFCRLKDFTQVKL